jgi:hypothetical protein
MACLMSKCGMTSSSRIAARQPSIVRSWLLLEKKFVSESTRGEQVCQYKPEKSNRRMISQENVSQDHHHPSPLNVGI